MYRLTRNKSRQNTICKRMREGKERKRLENVDLTPRFSVPNLRKVIIVIDYDLNKIDTFRLEKTSRINTYQVTRNKENPDNMGWSNFCKRLSVSYPSLLSPRSMY